MLSCFGRRAAALLLLSAAGWAALASTATAAPQPVRTVEEEPRRVVATTVTALQAEIDADLERLRDDPERLQRLVAGRVGPRADYDYMARLILGKYAARLPTTTHDAFAAALGRRLVRLYGRGLTDYPGVRLEFPANRTLRDGERATVGALAWLNPYLPVPIDFRLHRSEGRWRAYDLSVMGLDLVTLERAAFAAEAERLGLEAAVARRIRSERTVQAE